MAPQILRKAASFSKADVPVELEVDFEKREITGYAAVFGNVDNHGDVIEPTAFNKTLKERLNRNLLKFFLCHEYPVGVVGSAAPDSKGLFCRLKASRGFEAADRALRWAADRVTAHMSIGYDVVDSQVVEEPMTKRKINLLREIRLWEISTVIWPANEEATVEGVKSDGAPFTLRKGLGDLASVLSSLSWVKWVLSNPDAKLTDDDVTLVREVLAQMQESNADLVALVGGPADSTEKEITSLPLVATPTVEVVSKSLSAEDAAALASLTARLTLGREALETRVKQFNR